MAVRALFLGANIQNLLGVFWMRVPRNTTAEIQQCDSGQGCPFTGQAFADDLPEPTGGDWIEHRQSPIPIDDRWRALRFATPSEYRNIKAYAENEAGDKILFLARGELFLYRHGDQSVENVSEPAKTFSLTNRITAEGDEFHLWCDGTLQHKLSIRQ